MEQNGLYKVRLYYGGKKELVQYKSDHGLPLTLGPTDIVLLANKAWAASFARVESNKKAIAERGWAPLNRALLLHPDIAKTDPSLAQQPQVSPETEIDMDAENFSKGSSETVMDRMVRHVMRNGGTERRQIALAEGQSIQDSFNNVKRITSGVMVSKGMHSLRDPCLLTAMEQKDAVKAAAAKAARRKERLVQGEMITAVTKIFMKNPDMATC